MKQLATKIRSYLVPLAGLAAILGAVQDLITPLSSFGFWAAAIALAFGITIFLIPESSRFGAYIKSVTDNWKKPLVVSTLTLVVILGFLGMFSDASKDDKGVLANNFEAFKELQAKLLGIEKKIQQTNELVTENLETTKSVKEDTQEIVKNTRKSSRELLFDKGYDVRDSNSFFSAVMESSDQEFEPLMDAFKEAGFKINTRLNMPEGGLNNTYVTNEEKAKMFFTPATTGVIDLLVPLKIKPTRLDVISQVWSIDVGSHRSPISEGYARMKHASLPWDKVLPLITHPQIDFASGEDLGFSLISHRLKRKGNLTTKRGKYNGLHYSAIFGYTQFIDYFIRKNIDIDSTTETGYTALALAIELDQLEYARELRQRGAQLTSHNYLAVEIAMFKAMEFARENSSGEPEQNPFLDFVPNNVPEEILKDVFTVREQYINHDKKTYGESYQGQLQKLFVNYAGRTRVSFAAE